MKEIKTSSLSRKQLKEVYFLWNTEYPETVSYKTTNEFDAFLKYKKHNQCHTMITDNQNTIVGWCFSFERDDEIWFSLLVDSKHHGRGYGTQLMNSLKNNNIHLNGWVIDHYNDKKSNGDVYVSPIEFYLKIGFFIRPKIRIENNRISAVKVYWSIS